MSWTEEDSEKFIKAQAHASGIGWAIRSRNELAKIKAERQDAEVAIERAKHAKLEAEKYEYYKMLDDLIRRHHSRPGHINLYNAISHTTPFGKLGSTKRSNADIRPMGEAMLKGLREYMEGGPHDDMMDAINYSIYSNLTKGKQMEYKLVSFTRAANLAVERKRDLYFRDLDRQSPTSVPIKWNGESLEYKAEMCYYVEIEKPKEKTLEEKVAEAFPWMEQNGLEFVEIGVLTAAYFACKVYQLDSGKLAATGGPNDIIYQSKSEPNICYNCPGSLSKGEAKLVGYLVKKITQ